MPENDLIKFDPKNYRIHGDKNKRIIKKSLEDCGAGRSVLVDKDNILIAGNGVYEQAQALGLNVRVVESDGTDLIVVKRTDISSEDQKRKLLALADNHASDTSVFDFEVVAQEFNESVLSDYEFEFPEPVMEDDVEAKEDDFDVPEGLIETDIVLGDLFEIGEHRLLCGDSTQTDTFEKLMQGEFADMVVTDPPYNVAYEGKTKDALTIENDSMGNADFYQFLYDFYSALTTAVKKGGAIYVWHASSEVINFGKAMVDAGWLLKQQLIWVKNTMVMGRQDYQWKHEPCLYGWLAGGSHNWYSDRKQTTVINFDKPQRNGEHPTMKPIGLFAYQIENSSKIGDIVIDAFGGSGTTMVACEQLKRKARVIEFDPRYVQVIIDRMLKINPDIEIKKNGQKYSPQS